MGSEVDDSLKQGVDHLKTIFDLCDRDKDGCISAQDFKSIGLEQFGETQVRYKYQQGHSLRPIVCGGGHTV